MTSFCSSTTSEYGSVLKCGSAGFWGFLGIGLHLCFPLSLSIAKQMSCGMSSSGMCGKTGVARYLEKQTEPHLHAHLSPFPQGALWACTRDTWTTLEFLRDIDFSSASGAILSSVVLQSKHCPWSPWKT